MDNYNVNYRLDFCDKDLKRSCRIDVLKRGYSGSIFYFIGGNEPITLSYKNEDDNKFNQITISQATIELVASNIMSLDTFYTGDEKEYLVKLYISGDLYWTGFIMPDSAKEPFLTPPYEASLKATDLLATLKTIPYTDNLGLPIKKIDNVKNVILDCLNKTGLNINLVIGINTYEDSYSKGDSDCPLEQTYIDTNRFIDTNGKAYSCFEILQSLANQFTANLKQVNGAWWFVDIDELRNPSYMVRVFSSAGAKIENNLVSNVRKAGLNLPVETGLKTPLTLSNKDHEKQNIAAYKSVTSYYQFGYLSNDLKNGDLNKINNTNPLCPFDNWHSLGGQPIGYGEKTEIIDNTNLPKPNGDKFASFQNSDGPKPERVDVNKGMYSDPISILSTNSTRISFGLGSPLPRRDVYTILRVRLTGPDRPTLYYNRDSNSWGEQYRTFGIRVGDTSKTEISCSFQLTPPPYSGFITLYIHGSFENGGSSVWREYYYNNISINFDQNSLNKSPIGAVNICNQLGNYSESPDPVVLLFGDDNERQRTSWMRNVAGIPTVSWSGGQQLQRIVSKKILTQYQKTSRLFEGTFKGGASPLDIIQIDLTGGSFFFLSGDFAVKSGDAKLSLAELFIPDLVPINDVPTFFDYGDFKDSKGGNVGSPSGVSIPPFIPPIGSDAYIKNQSELQPGAKFNIVEGKADFFTANNFFGKASYVDNSGGALKFNWSGQPGQPAWLYGGNTPNDAYVYNPANFSVDNSQKWAGNSYNGNLFNGNPAYVMVHDGSYFRPGSAQSIANMLGTGKGGKFHQENNVFGVDADQADFNTSNFTYGVNAPYGGFLGQFGGSYGLQINAQYNDGSRIAFRTLNGDNGTRSTWKELLWNGYSVKTASFAGGTGNAYQTANIEVFRNGGNESPNIGFHWAGVVASQIALGQDGVIEIRNNPGTSYESFRALNISAMNNLGVGGNIVVNGNSSTNGEAYFDKWIRSRVTGTGWYHDFHGGGIYMGDNTWIRTYGNKGFFVEEGALLVSKSASVMGIVDTNEHFKTNGLVSMAGNYDSAGPTDKIIWTIGNNWTSIGSYYGLGYEYEKRSGFGHTISFAQAGVVNTRISLASGTIWTNGSLHIHAVQSNNFVQGEVAGTGFRIDQNGNAEVDSLTVRKQLKVTTLNIREIIGTGGAFAVTNVMEIQKAVYQEGYYWACYFNNNGGTIGNQFRIGDIVRCQIWDGTGVKYWSGEIYTVGGDYFTIREDSINGASRPAAGDKVFQFGSAADSARQGALYLTNSDPSAPYLDVMDGINSADWAGKTRVRVGRLTGIGNSVWGQLQGYGIWSDNCYFQNGYFSGSVNVTGGNAETQAGAANKADNALNLAKADSTVKANQAEANANQWANGRVQTLQNSLGTIAWKNLIERTELGVSLITGGKIVTDLLDALWIQANTVTAAYINALSLDASAIRTGTLDANRIDTIALQARIVTAQYINALAIDASAIKTGTLSADRIDVENLVVRNLRTNDTGVRLEIQKAGNRLLLYTGVGAANIVLAALPALSGSEIEVGLELLTASGSTSVRTEGVYSNGSMQMPFGTTSAHHGSIVAQLQKRKSIGGNGNNIIGAAVFAVDNSSGSTGNSQSHALAAFGSFYLKGSQVHGLFRANTTTWNGANPSGVIQIPIDAGYVIAEPNPAVSAAYICYLEFRKGRDGEVMIVQSGSFPQHIRTTSGDRFTPKNSSIPGDITMASLAASTTYTFMYLKDSPNDPYVTTGTWQCMKKEPLMSYTQWP